MEKVIKYRCEDCGELFNTEESCIEHEDRHLRVKKANEMLDEGHTLKEIQDACNIWYSIPEYLENVNKDNCFVVEYWQGCSKPAYRIDYIYMSGGVRLWGRGSWNGYYGNEVSLDFRHLKNPRAKEELFVDPRYGTKWS